MSGRCMLWLATVANERRDASQNPGKIAQKFQCGFGCSLEQPRGASVKTAAEERAFFPKSFFSIFHNSPSPLDPLQHRRYSLLVDPSSYLPLLRLVCATLSSFSLHNHYETTAFLLHPHPPTSDSTLHTPLNTASIFLSALCEITLNL